MTQLREKRDKQETRFLERTLEKGEKETKEETRLEDFRILGSGKRLSLREELEREREREGLRAGRAGGPWTGCPWLSTVTPAPSVTSFRITRLIASLLLHSPAPLPGSPFLPPPPPSIDPPQPHHKNRESLSVPPSPSSPFPPNRPPIALTSPRCYYPPLSPLPTAHHFCDFSLRRYEIGPLASSADRVLLIGNELYTCARFNAVRWVRMIKKRARRTMDRILRLRITSWTYSYV